METPRRVKKAWFVIARSLLLQCALIHDPAKDTLMCSSKSRSTVFFPFQMDCVTRAKFKYCSFKHGRVWTLRAPSDGAG